MHSSSYEIHYNCFPLFKAIVAPAAAGALATPTLDDVDAAAEAAAAAAADLDTKCGNAGSGSGGGGGGGGNERVGGMDDQRGTGDEGEDSSDGEEWRRVVLGYFDEMPTQEDKW